MRRFTQSYLTTIAILIVVVNLALVVVYTQRFAFNAQAKIGCVNEYCSQNIGTTELILTNLFLVGLGLIGYYIAHKIYEIHRPS